jgi:DNA repair exonuclease SbcCD nuclease subunit
MKKLKNIRKIFVLGDLHLGIRNNSLEWSEVQDSFLTTFFLDKIDELGFDPERDILVQVGDWNHVRESTNVRIYKLSLEIAKKLTSKFKRGVFVILGNHDVYYKDRTDTHSLEGFDKIYDNFHIFTSTEPLKINNHNFLMVPWIEDLTKLKSSINNNREANYVFCHADIKGFDLNKVTKIEHGLERGDLIDFKRIYSGHIHIRQEKGNVLYVGTPYQMDRGDRGNQKGFYVLDVSGDTISEEFIPNTFSPQYHQFEILDLLQFTPDKLIKIFNNNFIDISIESEFSKRFPVSQFIELIKDFGHRKIEFFSYSKSQIIKKSDIEISSNYEYNLFSILDEQVKTLNLPPDKVSKITTKFKEIYDLIKNAKNYN